MENIFKLTSKNNEILLRRGGEPAAAQAAVHRDAGLGGDELRAHQLYKGVRERARRSAAVGGAREGVGGRGLRGAPRPRRAHAGRALRVHAEPRAQGAPRPPARHLPDTRERLPHLRRHAPRRAVRGPRAAVGRSFCYIFAYEM